MLFTLSVNGQSVRVDANPYMPLAWVLREKFGLQSAKFSCRAGICVACTVNIDGIAVRSCMMPVSTVGQAKIVTIEGLSGRVSDAVRRAWVEMSVPECRYCKPGIIMAVAALLERSPRPTDAEVTRSLGSFCSCGSDPVVRYAIQIASRLLAQSRKTEKLRRGPMLPRPEPARLSQP